MLKEKLKSGSLVLGSWMTIPSPAIAEIMARSGFDLIVVDLEHSTLSIAEAGELIRTIALAGSSPFVRLSSNDPVQIKRVLDVGAEGIIVPMVTTLAEIQKTASSMFYPPVGSRGVGLGRAQGYGPEFKNYFENLSGDLTLVAQVEHADALPHLEEIFGSGLVNAYIIGPYDLSCSLGKPGRFDDLEFKNAIEEIREVAARHGVPGGEHVVEPDVTMVKKSIASDCRLMIYSVDFRIIESDCSRAVKKLRSETP